MNNKERLLLPNPKLKIMNNMNPHMNKAGANQSTPSLKIDLNQLKELSGNDADFMVEIIELILENAPAAASSMKELLAAADFDTLSKVAHKLKSTLNILGDQDLLQVIDWLEHTCQEKPASNEISGMVSYIDKYIESLVTFLGGEIKQLRNVA